MGHPQRKRKEQGAGIYKKKKPYEGTDMHTDTLKGLLYVYVIESIKINTQKPLLHGVVGEDKYKHTYMNLKLVHRWSA